MAAAVAHLDGRLPTGRGVGSNDATEVQLPADAGPRVFLDRQAVVVVIGIDRAVVNTLHPQVEAGVARQHEIRHGYRQAPRERVDRLIREGRFQSPAGAWCSRIEGRLRDGIARGGD